MTTSPSSSSSLDVEKLQAPMFATHKSGINRSYEWRKSQLKTLHKMIVERRDTFREALCLDLGRDRTEAIYTDIIPVESEIAHMLDHLKGWMEPEYVATPGFMFPASARVERRPLQAPGVLIIGPSNYPLSLCLRPLAGVLAGGNPAVMKPSELTSHTANALARVVPEYFDPGVVQVVLGDIPETTALLSVPWAKVVFTGSERVGRVVAQACAATLTPCLLELGGKSVVVVDETVSPSHVQNVADRVIFAKCLNAGQVCVAPDTLLVHESHVATLTEALVRAVERQFGEDPQKGELPRIVNARNAQRLFELIQQVEETPAMTQTASLDTNYQQTTILSGGTKACDVSNRFIAPTIVLNPPKSCRLLTEEIFGPILPVIPFSSRQGAIQWIQTLGTATGIPLFLYVFTPKETIFQQFTDACPSGGAVRNDMIVQLINFEQPFGGVGASGNGRYFGRYSFEAFTHLFPVTQRALGSLWDWNNLRCHPYAGWKSKVMEGYVMYLPKVPAAVSSPGGWFWASASLVVIPIVAAMAGSPMWGGDGTPTRLRLASALEGLAAYLRNG